MIELFFIEAQYQCGWDATELATFSVEVVQTLQDGTETTLDTLTVGQKAILDLTEDDMSNIALIPTQLTGGDCIRENILVPMDYGDPVPTMPGFDEQTSIQDIYDNHIKDAFEGLWLFELGEKNTTKAGYDLNDLVFRYDLDPYDEHKQPKVFGD